MVAQQEPGAINKSVSRFTLVGLEQRVKGATISLSERAALSPPSLVPLPLAPGPRTLEENQVSSVSAGPPPGEAGGLERERNERYGSPKADSLLVTRKPGPNSG